MRKKAGFSLFEFLLITAFFCMAIYIVKPFYYRWKARSTQVHVLAKLSNIFKIQQMHFTSNESYITDFEQLKASGFEINENDLYTYQLKKPEQTDPGYVVTATSKKKLAPCSKFSKDVWTMNEKKDFNNEKNGTIGCH